MAWTPAGVKRGERVAVLLLRQTAAEALRGVGVGLRLHAAGDPAEGEDPAPVATHGERGGLGRGGGRASPARVGGVESEQPEARPARARRHRARAGGGAGRGRSRARARRAPPAAATRRAGRRRAAGSAAAGARPRAPRWPGRRRCARAAGRSRGRRRPGAPRAGRRAAGPGGNGTVASARTRSGGASVTAARGAGDADGFRGGGAGVGEPAAGERTGRRRAERKLHPLAPAEDQEQRHADHRRSAAEPAEHVRPARRHRVDRQPGVGASQQRRLAEAADQRPGGGVKQRRREQRRSQRGQVVEDPRVAEGSTHRIAPAGAEREPEDDQQRGRRGGGEPVVQPQPAAAGAGGVPKGVPGRVPGRVPGGGAQSAGGEAGSERQRGEDQCDAAQQHRGAEPRGLGGRPTRGDRLGVQRELLGELQQDHRADQQQQHPQPPGAASRGAGSARSSTAPSTTRSRLGIRGCSRSPAP